MPSLRPGLVSGVDPSKQYLARRQLSSLENRDQSFVGHRADRLVANAPADGFVDWTELNNPKLARLLRPDEQVALTDLLKNMEWAGVAVAPFTLPTPAPLRAVETITSTPVDRRRAMDIGLLVGNPSYVRYYQEEAKRLQLLVDSDGNPDTLSLQDLDAVARHPDRDALTTDELSAMEPLREALLRFQNKQSTWPRRALEVGELGTTQTELMGPGGAVSLTLSTTTQLVSGYRAAPMSARVGGSTPTLTLQRTSELRFGLREGYEASIINRATGEARRLDGAAPPAGDYFVEVWQRGQRVEQLELTVPAVPATETLDVSEHLGATLTSLGRRLKTDGRTWSVDPNPSSFPDPVRTADLADFAGIYDHPQLGRIQLFADGALRMTEGGVARTYQPTYSYDGRPEPLMRAVDHATASVRFEGAERSARRMFIDGVEVKPAHRVA